MNQNTQKLLNIDNLCISINKNDIIKDVSIQINKGEMIGLVGESGCGKSTVALGVMQDLGVNGKIVDGSIKFKGQDL